MLFREIIAVYYENHTKPTNTLCGQNKELLNVIGSGAYSYHWLLRVKISDEAFSHAARPIIQVSTVSHSTQYNQWWWWWWW
jgi:hypothetical protein